MRKFNLISLLVILGLLCRNYFCINQDQANGLNERYYDGWSQATSSNIPFGNSQTNVEDIVSQKAKCPKCDGSNTVKKGKNEKKYQYKDCNRQFLERAKPG